MSFDSKTVGIYDGGILPFGRRFPLIAPYSLESPGRSFKANAETSDACKKLYDTNLVIRRVCFCKIK